MYQIKKFDIASVAIFSFFIFLVIGILVAIPFALMTFLMSTLSDYNNIDPEFNSAFSIFSGVFVFFLPIMYGVMGTIMNVIIALIYNLLAKPFGGIKIELVKLETFVNRFADIKQNPQI